MARQQVRLGAIILTSALALTLTACTASDGAPAGNATDHAVAKEAGALGSRICFINETDVPMSAAPSGRVVQQYADHNVGVAGSLSTTTELCFAGWNSREVMMKSKGSRGLPVYTTGDAIAAVNIDGNYNALGFYALNPSLSSPEVRWSGNPEAETFWTVKYFGSGDSTVAEAAGHTFSVTRRDDSEFYKEFVVRFTR